MEIWHFVYFNTGLVRNFGHLIVFLELWAHLFQENLGTRQLVTKLEGTLHKSKQAPESAYTMCLWTKAKKTQFEIKGFWLSSIKFHWVAIVKVILNYCIWRHIGHTFFQNFGAKKSPCVLHGVDKVRIFPEPDLLKWGASYMPMRPICYQIR